MTLEAALIVPIFFLFVIFLIMLIRISVAQMALDRSVSETAEVIATHAYPAGLAASAAEGKIDDFIQEKSMGTVDLDKAKALLDKGLQNLGINIGDSLNGLSASALNPIVQKQFKDTIGDFFDSHDVKVIKADGLTSLTAGSDAHIDIVAQYTMDMFVPFVNKSIILKSRAYEKLWVGS
ncbi:hypothetical protein GCM10007096_09690 [Pullulanibacillus pueri]|uniref:TadE-like protein n=2 Tax=Pullulanibacillus pueri TaxID=1437324 RepID=A0A8J2ZTQ4_9BACL|nr:hypothetical protein GCM10007096_09690 [Pullulanibacillus pueri]